jgi:hypothetical protein
VIRIGVLTTINMNCAIDERKSWNSSNPAFEELDVRDSFWRYDESQLELSAGQYALLQHNRTKHYIPSTTLKARTLEDVINKSCLALDVLDNLFGVQVSFCTGVARRVPLRILMADLMPIIAEIFPQNHTMWISMNVHDKVVEAMRSGSLLDWFKTLATEEANSIDHLVSQILLTLEPTGVNEEGDELTVAWIHERPQYQCFKIPTSSKPNSWMRVLSDSTDCATFAYITTKCLETNTIKCRGPSPHWHRTTPLLETSVLRCNSQPNNPLGLLEHNKMGSRLQVTVEREPVSNAVSLYVSPSGIPAKIWQRVSMLERNHKEVSRIRERRASTEPEAEVVAILTKPGLRPGTSA